LNENESFFAKHQTYILNILFVVFVVMTIFLVVIYFLWRQKDEELEQVKKELSQAKECEL
jgi:regulatory protein YycI of two-component signal transduction system YycFG